MKLHCKIIGSSRAKNVIGVMNYATTNAVFVNDRRSIRNGIIYLNWVNEDIV